MKVMANELKETLSVMTVAAGTDRSVETGSNIYFTGKKIALFSGDVYIDKCMDTEFTGGVDANLFESIVDKYGTNEIEIDREENLLTLKRKRSISKLVINDNNQFPTIKFSDDTEWRKMPVDFSALLDQACQITSNNFNEPTQTCIHINGRYMEANDDIHFGIFKMKGLIQDNLFIRKDFVKILTKFEPTDYRLADSWICFLNAKQYFIAIRKVDVPDYPNLEEAYNSSKGDQEIELPDKVISSLERAELFLKNEFDFNKFIRLEAANGKLTLFTETRAGSYKDKLSIPEGIEFTIQINPKYLVQMLFYSNKIVVGQSTVSCEAKGMKMIACLME